MNSCDNCGANTQNEPLTLCDECEAQDRLGIVHLKAKVAELELQLGAADAMINEQQEALRVDRERIAELGKRNAGLLQENQDCSAWFGVQQHDLEDCLKSLGEIANAKGFDNIGKWARNLAKKNLDSLID